MKKWIDHGVSCLLVVLLYGTGFAQEGSRPNVLFIMIDDLRPTLGVYGDPLAHTPNIDRLAAEGTVFLNAFTAVPVCGASRAAIMSGRKPTTNRFLTFNSRLDEDLPGATTLPEHFRNNGYVSLANGKLFDVMTDSPQSWSEPVWVPTGDWYSSVPVGDRGEYLQKAYVNPLASIPGPAWEREDVEDSAYPDGVIADKSVEDIRRFAESGEPFFLGVGIRKPHLPFTAPEKYWALYDREDFSLPETYSERSPGTPANPYHTSGELRQYSGIPDEGPVTDEEAITLIHGYYAAASYADALVGKVIDALETEGLDDDTIVVLIGDHGYHLGEHTLWNKHALFDIALHSPMIILDPTRGSGRVNGVTDFLDIFPTLNELAGLPEVPQLDGVSLVPALDDSSAPTKEAAFSKWFEGTSLRTIQYRYTEWLTESGDVSARMLFDLLADPQESSNLAEQAAYSDLVNRFSVLISEDGSNSPWSEAVRRRVSANAN